MRLPKQPKPVRQKLAVPDGDRVPAGQFLSEKFPVLSYGSTPHIDLAGWRLQVSGLVEAKAEFTWEQFMALPQIAMSADFHCVTQWSRLDNAWEGVPLAEVLRVVRPTSEARYVMVHCYDGYTTNLPLEVLRDETVILAHKHDGEPLTPDHGWPLRLVVPKRYGWKSAKWIGGLEFLDHNEPGFWEARGYHMEGDPWKEERFWPELSWR